MRNVASIQVHLFSFLGEVNIAAEIDSGYKLLLEKHNNQVKTTEILSKIINSLKFCGNVNFL